MENDKQLIIIIEDDYLIALDLKEILESEGYSTMTKFNSIEHIIEQIKNLNPVLVIIDINLKMDKDGIYIGKFLLDYDKVPYVYITSYSDSVTVDNIKTTRPYGYIKKPFTHIDIVTNANIIINNFRHRRIDVDRTIKENEINNDEIPFIIKKSINYINQNIQGKIEINELARQTKWDTFHFSRMFKKYVGLSPYNYILKRKIEIAQSLLMESDQKIVDIAFELGFDNHSNFSVRFKKITGFSPENYRKIDRVKKMTSHI
jgi:AraC-like DNA-binding protein